MTNSKRMLQEEKKPQLSDIKICYLLFFILISCLKKPTMFSILCDEHNIVLFFMENMHLWSSAAPPETLNNLMGEEERQKSASGQGVLRKA